MSAPFFRYADTIGDGSGSVEMNVDGTTPVVFKIQPRTGERSLRVERVLISVRDSGTFDTGAYGNGIALTAGVSMCVHDANTDAVKLDLLGGFPVKTNGDWAAACYDTTVDTYGTGDQVMSIRWTFSKTGVALPVSSDEYLGITIADNLTGLSHQRMFFQGTI